MNGKGWRVGLVVGATMVIITAVAWWWLAPTKPNPAALAASVAAGQGIYASACASCHGAQLEGQPDWRVRRPDGRLPAPPHDATGHTWHHSDDDLFALTKFGPAPFAPPNYESDMPAFAQSLTDQEIRDVIAYIKSTWPPDIQARQAAISAPPRRP